MSVSTVAMSNRQTSGKHERNLEYTTDNSAETPTGLKVEIVTLPGPAICDSKSNHINNLNHLSKIYSKKKCSLISRSNLIISKTLHLSPLITTLQI